MEELFNLTYKDEVEALKDSDEYEKLGDERYINHQDMEARLYWAFCRPSGSHPNQISDSDPIVSIMAFNHSRLPALERFKRIHKDVIEKNHLRIKIKNRTRMLFRDLVDNDFTELNKVLEIVPIFLDVAIEQLKNGRKWNDIPADEFEATKFIELVKKSNLDDNNFYEAIYLKLRDISEYEPKELKEFIENLLTKKNINKNILEHYQNECFKNLENCNIHILQKKSIESLVKKIGI